MVRIDGVECQVLPAFRFVDHALCPVHVLCLCPVRKFDLNLSVLVIGFDCGPLDLEVLVEEDQLGTLS